jgi:hypothetical protein
MHGCVLGSAAGDALGAIGGAFGVAGRDDDAGPDAAILTRYPPS